MLNHEEFKLTAHQKDILRILQKASHRSENLVWQNIEGVRRQISIKYFEIDFVAREMVFFSDDDMTFVDQNATLYVKLGFRTTVFKVQEFRLEKTAIHFPIPPEVRVRELRSEERFELSIEDQDEVSLIDRTLQSSELTLVDISKHGLGLITKNKKIEKGSVFLKEIFGAKLKAPLKGQIVHLYQMEDGWMRVGIRLENELNKDFFKHLS